MGYDGTSKTDINVLAKGNGGADSCSSALPKGRAVFGGCRLENGRFVTFFHADDETPTMQKGRASMHKNGETLWCVWVDCVDVNACPHHSLVCSTGVLNVLEGSDGEIEIKKEISEESTSVSDNPGAQLEQEETGKVKIGQVEAAPVAVKETISSEGTVVVSYEVLKGISEASKLPPGVDPLNREQSLSDDEFFVVFGMDKDSFYSLPGWKRTKLKKDAGLF